MLQKDAGGLKQIVEAQKRGLGIGQPNQGRPRWQRASTRERWLVSLSTENSHLTFKNKNEKCVELFGILDQDMARTFFAPNFQLKSVPSRFISLQEVKGGGVWCEVME